MKVAMYNADKARTESMSFKIAQCQADPLVAKRNINRTSTAMWTDNSDFLVHNTQSLQKCNCKIHPRENHIS